MAKESPVRLTRRSEAGPAAPARRRSTRWRTILLTAAIATGPAAAGHAASPTPTTPTPDTGPTAKATIATAAGGLVIAQRIVCQDQGAWQVEYRLRNAGNARLTVAPEDVAAKVEGWVSNSRIAAHALPRWSSVVLSRGRPPSAEGDVIAGPEEAKRCKERLAVSIGPDDGGEGCDSIRQAGHDGAATGPATGPASTSAPGGKSRGSSVTLAPGASMRVRVRLEHEHVLYGDYDPLLGTRAVELTIGPAVVRDVVPLDRERYRARPRCGWPEIPTDRRDTRQFVSAPDSLHLEADVPGHQYYRFPERAVRYDTRMRLRFSYLIARGPRGLPPPPLAGARHPLAVPHPGEPRALPDDRRQWTRVERIVRTDPQATHVGIEISIVNDTDIGEMWIDDISFEPLEVAQGGP